MDSMRETKDDMRETKDDMRETKDYMHETKDGMRETIKHEIAAETARAKNGIKTTEVC